MSYRETQEKLITDSHFLLLLFILCAAGMMLVSTVIFFHIYLFFYHATHNTYFYDMPQNIWYALAIFNLVIIFYMLCAYQIRMVMLKSGGAHIAEYCGATEITAKNTDYYSKRFQDIVEELAIACSLPVPKTYLLESCQNINAFAAGYDAEDAAITITKGAMVKLNRDELQAIVAHEFSHILHQDMRLNMQLIAFNASINSFIEFTWILDINRYENPIDFIFLPLAPLIIIMLPFGIVGSVFSSLLKLGINRKREFLADASAIRYTRYAAGLLGALKKIGGIPADREFENSSLRFVSHMMFNNNSIVSGLVSSHPLLISRIRQYEPTFTNSKMLELCNEYAQHTPDGKQEDIALGYCPDGETYVRNPAHENANIAHEKSSDYMQALQNIHNQSAPGEMTDRLLIIAMIALISVLMIFMLNNLYRSITPAATLPPGMMVATDPGINRIAGIPDFSYRGFTITPIATITMQARVLNTANYKKDKLSKLASQELYLGWKDLSDSTNIKKVKFGLSDRTYGFIYFAGISVNDVCEQTAHALIIPASDDIANYMSRIKIDDIINLSGYVVNFTSPNHDKKTSDFCDTSGNSNHINDLNIWVTSVEIIN